MTKHDPIPSGCIATLIREGQTVVRHFPDGLREVVAYCDRNGYSVQTISTPTSILGDLRHAVRPGRYELLALARVGRKDLLA